MWKRTRASDEAERRALELLRRLPVPEPPAQLRGRVMAAVRGRRARPLWRRWVPRLATAGACLAVWLTWQAVRPSGVVAVAPDAFATAGFVSEHTVLTAADPLTDSAAWYAVGVVSGRQAAGQGWPERHR